MLKREENIFFNIVKNETSLTEVLCNLMMYKSFRKHFIEFVKSKNEKFNIDAYKIKYDDFTTEKDFGSVSGNSEVENSRAGRGDLVLTVDEKDYIFELKIEIYTALTENQPGGYIKYLCDNGQTKDDLFFILPKSYRHIKDLKGKGIEECNILFWEDFIQSLKKEGLTDVQYIKDFIKILNDRWFYAKEFDFTEHEKSIIRNKTIINIDDRLLPKIMMELINKVDEITDRVVSKKRLYWRLNDNGNYGGFIRNEEKEEILWFGIDYKVWNEIGIPLTIGVDAYDKETDSKNYEELFQSLFKVKTLDLGDDAKFYYIPLPFKDYDTTDKIILKILDVKNKLGLD